MFINTLSQRHQQAYLANLEPITDPKKSTFFFGKTGFGKTTACLLLAKKFEKELPKNIDSSNCMRFLTMFEFQNLCQKSLDRETSEGWQARKSLEFFQSVTLLIFDDLGVIKATEYMNTKLLEILENRLNNGVITYFTSQKNIDELSEQYQANIARRIKDIVTYGNTLNVIELKSDAWLKNIEFKPVNVNQESEATYLSDYEKAQGISKIVETVSTNNSQKHLISLIKGVLNCDSQGNERLARKLAEKYNINFDLIKN